MLGEGKSNQIAEQSKKGQSLEKVLENVEHKKASETIFVKGLNDEVTENLMYEIFSKFSGYKSLRLMRGYAIVEYDSIENATIALNKTNNKKLTEACRIQVHFSNS